MYAQKIAPNTPLTDKPKKLKAPVNQHKARNCGT